MTNYIIKFVKTGQIYLTLDTESVFLKSRRSIDLTIFILFTLTIFGIFLSENTMTLDTNYPKMTILYCLPVLSFHKNSDRLLRKNTKIYFC